MLRHTIVGKKQTDRGLRACLCVKRNKWGGAESKGGALIDLPTRTSYRALDVCHSGYVNIENLLKDISWSDIVISAFLNCVS